MYLLGWYLFIQYRQEVSDIARSNIQMNCEDIDAEFEMINQSIVDVLVGNATINDIRSAGNSSNSLTLVKRLSAERDMLSQLETLGNRFDGNYIFWMISPAQDIYLITANSYTDKQNFEKFIRGYGADRLIKSSSRQWTITEEGGLLISTGFQENGICIGCTASFADLLEPMWDSKLVSSIYVYCPEKDTAYAVREDRTGAEDKTKDWQNFPLSFSFSNAEAELYLMAETSIEGTLFWYQIVLLAAAAGVIIVSIGSILYTGRMVNRPIQLFYESIQKYKETGRFSDPGIYDEFSKAGEIFRKLEQEISDLKVQVYEERLNTEKAQVEYLQLQIRPHFYINCLNSIFSMAQMNKTSAIEKLAKYVTDYMRSSLRRGMHPVELSEEITTIQNYVKIHEVLYRYRCEVITEISPELMNALIPPLLLMVFAENCIKHTATGHGSILLRIRGFISNPDTQEMTLQISDDGPGFPEDFLEQWKNHSLHSGDERFQIGILNAQKRLSLLYGLRASMEMCNLEKGGACVILKLPCMKEDEQA